VAIGQTVAEIMVIFDFSNMVVVRHLGFVVRLFGPPRIALFGLYHRAKFGWNRCSNFDDMHALFILKCGLKRAIHAPKIGVLGIGPLNGERYQRNSKGTSLCKSMSLTI